MYYLTDICFMCLKNSIKLQSVFIQDNDGIVFIEKIRCCYPEIINSTPDAHKLACTECLEKLRFLYDFKQSGIRNNTMIANYLRKLQCEDKTLQHPSVVLPTRKRRKNLGNSFVLKIKNVNLNFTNGELLNKIDHSCQSTTTENRNLEIKNVEKVCPVTETENIYLKQESQFSTATEKSNLENKNVEKVFPDTDTETIYIKQERQLSDDESTISCYDEGSNSSNENDPDFEISEEGPSRSNNYNNQNTNTIILKSCYVSVVKFCHTCQDLLFTDLNNIHMHLHYHMETSCCSECEDFLHEIHKFQRHMFSHCEIMVEILDNVDRGENFSCALCEQQFDEFRNFKKHIYDKHITNLKCVVCSKAFTYKQNLLRHILTTHCEVRLYKCKLCPMRYVCKDGIKDHMLSVHYSGKVCGCEFCHLTFKSANALRQHISRHYEENSRSEEDTTAVNFSNFAMAEESNSRTSYSSHFQESVSSSLIPNTTTITEPSYCEPNPRFNTSDICEICQKMFFNLINISAHLNAHMQEYCCSMCKDSADNISRLQRHMLTPCGNTKTNTPQVSVVDIADKRDNDEVTCVVCQREFKFNILKKHMHSHMPNLTCVICNKTMSTKPSLQRHLLHHCNLKPLQCEVCGKKFTVKESLKYHVETAHSAEVFGCQYCQKTLSCPNSLRFHIRTMHPEFTYRCEVCEKSFIRKKDLEKHAKIHSKK